MNSIVTNGPWRPFKIQLRKTWSELTDADLEAICRNSDELVHVVQHCYGIQQDEATSLPRAIERFSEASLRVPAAEQGIQH